MSTFTCSSCDNTTSGDALPATWCVQKSAVLGDLIRCPACTKDNAVKIATSNMTTEQIMSAKPATAGDDSPLSFSADDVISGAAQTRLRTIISRCQNVMSDISDLRGGLKEVLDEAKGEGFDVKIIRKLLAELQKDKVKRQEEATLLDLYATAIGEEL